MMLLSWSERFIVHHERPKQAVVKLAVNEASVVLVAAHGLKQCRQFQTRSCECGTTSNCVNSNRCEIAFSWYLEHLKTGTYRVSFIHGIEPAHSSPTVALAIESPPIMVDDMISVMEESIILGRKLGQEYMKPAKVAKLSYKAFLHIDTKPGSAIVRSAAKHKAQLIVHGSRGFGVIKRALLDNISDYVVHNSTVPVAVVPPKPAQSRK
ncbi:hypothetical protein ECG_00818 [Echinococcus granulosus]|uniref:Universal stress protein n=1 Tax=Echinococcus granulosus TaxID=6210 RepID=A0A068WFD7_ECHGR|nr:hypothetical protein ECG_00818 [Echinococcus granulosus]CDS16312.1 universal stress protein [Echinococcus granulosus]